jgi:(p)ppGpp synthase/HD superfamily hydrolase
MNTPTVRLLTWAQQHGPDADRAVSRALILAQQAHRGQFRRNGDPHIEHLVAVALILAASDATLETVVAGLLHDLCDVTSPLPVEDLRAEFGNDLAQLLIEFTAIDHSPELPPVATTDHRALHIKIAVRLHNMRTIRYITPDSQRRDAAHTRTLVAPLAHQLGFTAIGSELDALATATLHTPSTAIVITARPARGTYRHVVGYSALHSTLRVGGLLLPAHCRQRWQQDWDGELHAAENLFERIHFAVNILRGLPALAVITRRSESR